MLVGRASQRSRVKLKDLPKSLQPVERLELRGASNLSDEELLAIILGTGNHRQNVLKLAQKLLQIHPLSRLSETGLEQLIKIPGVGKMKAARIQAAVELGKRVINQPLWTKNIIKTAEDALIHLQDIAGKKQEHLLILYLNSRHELIEKEIIALGGLNRLFIEPREIFQKAVTLPCSHFIIAHNHPSDDPTPSAADIKVTKKLFEAGELMGILLIDHIIVSQSRYYSFKESLLT